MDGVNKTLYIPLYGKAAVSRQGILLRDPKAEEIWSKAGFPLKGKAKSKWLTYYMGMRAAVFDRWLAAKMAEMPGAAGRQHVLQKGGAAGTAVPAGGAVRHGFSADGLLHRVRGQGIEV